MIKINKFEKEVKDILNKGISNINLWKSLYSEVAEVPSISIKNIANSIRENLESLDILVSNNEIIDYLNGNTNAIDFKYLYSKIDKIKYTPKTIIIKEHIKRNNFLNVLSKYLFYVGIQLNPVDIDNMLWYFKNENKKYFYFENIEINIDNSKMILNIK